MSRAERRRAAKLAGKSKPNADITALKADAHARYKAGDLAGARVVLKRVLRQTPKDPAALNFAALLAHETGDFETAADHFETAHALAPAAATENALAETLRSAMMAALTPKDAKKVPQFAERLLAVRPRSLEAAAMQALALTQTGQRDQADAALGIDALVEVQDFDPPTGWATIADFNHDLADEIAGDPSMAVPDASHPTYHNRHLKITAPLDITRKGPVEKLTEMIEAAVADYRAKRVGLDHPFLQRWPEASGLEAWGTLLEGEGTVDAHIHLEGYLGMVYYPELPPEVSEGQGWLELGRPPEDFPLPMNDPIVKLLEPKPGRLVLFPGYMFHRTTPFKSSHRRISIAYDVVAR